MAARYLQSVEDAQSSLFGDLNRVVNIRDAVLAEIPRLDDERLLQLRDYSEEIGRHAFRVTCACDAEIVARAESRRGKDDPEGIGVKATVTQVAAQKNVAPQRIFENAQIHKTFFAAERSPGARTSSDDGLDKAFYLEALRYKPDPRAALELIAQKKDDNPFYDTRDARRDVKALSRAPLPTTGPSTGADILTGDMGLLQDALADGSVDLILTDPPYLADDLAIYERLAALARAKLKPGALCLAYVANAHLPVIAGYLARHLDYWWTLGIAHTGGNLQMWNWHIFAKWRPVLAFSNGACPREDGEWLMDLVRGGGEDKRYHAWGQDAQEITHWIETLTLPGALVVDPFCGGGPVPAACKATGRRWLATEVDPERARVARARVDGEPAS